MNVGDTVEMEILSNGMDGEGVARMDGKVVFVPYTLKGERVRAVVKQVKKKYAVASAIKILSPSEYHRTPSCPHYYRCGGCDMGHVSPEYRREVLLAELENNLKKIAGISFSPSEFIESSAVNGRRNKLSMPFGLADGKVVLGMYRHNTHVVEPVVCGSSGELAKSIAQIVVGFANFQKLSVYDEKTGRGLLRHLVIREISGRASVTLVINAEGFGEEKQLADLLPENADFFVCPNMRRDNVIMGDSVRLVKGRPVIDVNVLGVKAELSPLSFFQVNDEIRDKLYSAAIDEVGAKILIDLYSGIGITSNLAAKKCEKVVAVEVVPQAVKNADRTAALNGNSERITNICGVAEKVLPDIVDSINGACDVLVDPPRKGCGKSVTDAVARVRPERLIYISCNHATMCRDIGAFLNEASDRYEITQCKIFDMFPDTHHTEVLCVLKKAVVRVTEPQG